MKYLIGLVGLIDGLELGNEFPDIDRTPTYCYICQLLLMGMDRGEHSRSHLYGREVGA